VVVAVVAVALLLLLAGTALAMPTSGRKVVASGQTYVVDKITKLNYLKIAEGGIVKAAPGYSITMTINGVETGNMIYVFDTGIDITPVPPPGMPPMPPFDQLAGETRIKAGTYRGDIVLTPTVEMQMPRGALFGPGNEPTCGLYRTGRYTSMAASSKTIGDVGSEGRTGDLHLRQESADHLDR
jgi:hypothetical protein